MILKRNFYERDTFIVAKELLGKFLVHETKEGTTIGKIVEIEAYMGPQDMGSHAYNNLRTERTEVMYGPKGRAYVYFIYGMYFCLNIISGEAVGNPEAILIRALEPIDGIEIMLKRRGIDKSQIKNLTSGPGKLFDAMNITKKQNGVDLTKHPLFIEEGVKVDKSQIVCAKRIGVDYAGKWKDMPWRFFIKSNDFVSVKKS